MAIVLAVRGLIWFPIGIAVGVLIIWYLFSDEAERAFAAPAGFALHESPESAAERNGGLTKIGNNHRIRPAMS